MSMMIHHKRRAMVSLLKSFTDNGDVSFSSERLNRKQHSLYQLNTPPPLFAKMLEERTFNRPQPTLRPFNISASGNPTGLLIRHSSVFETSLHIKIKKFPHVCKVEEYTYNVSKSVYTVALFFFHIISACWNCDRYIPTWNTWCRFQNVFKRFFC